MIITKTPFRISFFGGGTDYPAWLKENNGSVIGTTINKYCYISCRVLPPFFENKHRIVYSIVENVNTTSEIQHPSVRATLEYMGIDDGIEIHHDGDLPARTGLGSSSSFTIGLIHALAYINNQKIVLHQVPSGILREDCKCLLGNGMVIDPIELINEFEEITRWPKKRSDKEYIIKYLSEKFESGVEYSEKEVNQIIKRHHSFNDFALLRRELISKKYLFRTDDCSKYWKN